MIDYVEIRNTALELIGLIDTAKSIIWETQYYGAGAFEVYTAATPDAIALLQCGNFVTRVENEGVGIIEAVEVVFSAADGRMLTASGRLAKSILDRRLITYVNGNVNAPTIFSGNVEARARGLVQDNAIACYRDKARTIPYAARNISLLQLGALAGLPAETESMQATHENLLTYTDELLQQYGYGAKMIRSGGKLAYTVYCGKDRSIGNAEGNEPVIFSTDFDNLIGSNYRYDETGRKTYALIGGDGEGLEQFHAECNAALSGLERREVFVDASAAKEMQEQTFAGDGATSAFVLSHPATVILSAKIKMVSSALAGADAEFDARYTFDASANKITLAVALPTTASLIVTYFDATAYNAQLVSEGGKELAQRVAAESFAGSIDLANSPFVYGVDFEIGDIVTVQDNGINKYINARIISVPEVQDDDGYQINIDFEAVS